VCSHPVCEGASKRHPQNGRIQQLKIDKDKHPVLSQVPVGPVRTAFEELFDIHTDKNHVKFRADCGQRIVFAEKSSITCKDSKGETMTHEKTVFAICTELGIGRSSYFQYRSDYIALQGFAQKIRDAALEARFNLAKEHVQDKYNAMLAPADPVTGTPAGTLHGKNLNTLTPLEVKGVIAELEAAKPIPGSGKKGPSKSKGVARFQELIDEAFDYAKDEKLKPTDELTSLFGRVFRLTTKLEVKAADIKSSMQDAALESLTHAGANIWQEALHGLAITAEPAPMAVGVGAGAGPVSMHDQTLDMEPPSSIPAGAPPAGTTAPVPGDVFDLNTSIPADAAAAKKKK
jgi:hypothetical protein